MAVIRQSDFESAVNALTARGMLKARVRSTDGFLGQRNHLQLVGIPQGKLEEAADVLRKICGSRVEYVASPLENLPYSVGVSKQVEVRGVTVFVFDVERCEVI